MIRVPLKVAVCQQAASLEREIIDIDCCIETADDHPYLCAHRSYRRDYVRCCLRPAACLSTERLHSIRAENSITGVEPLHIDLERECIGCRWYVHEPREAIALSSG